MWRRGLRPILRVLPPVSGWLTLYLAIGGALGYMLCSPGSFTATCVARGTTFINVRSGSEWVIHGLLAIIQSTWAVAVQIPRGLLLPIAASFAALQALPGSEHLSGSDLLNALRWLTLSLPTVLLVRFGIPYWWRRDRMIATGAGVMLLLAVITIVPQA